MNVNLQPKNHWIFSVPLSIESELFYNKIEYIFFRSIKFDIDAVL